MTKRLLPVALLFAAILSVAPAAADEFSPGKSLAAPMAGGAERIGSDRRAPAAQNDDRAAQKLISEGRKMPANRGASSGGGSHTERQA
ncbi:MAG TPA: hypothetical protein VG475_08205 [Pseudolabrys sp.]|nr:hypothetical protein [Pseudolabrys sp.]